jgi:hypothetical protein
MNVKCKTWGFGFPCERTFVSLQVAPVVISADSACVTSEECSFAQGPLVARIERSPSSKYDYAD